MIACFIDILQSDSRHHIARDILNDMIERYEINEFQHDCIRIATVSVTIIVHIGYSKIKYRCSGGCLYTAPSGVRPCPPAPVWSEIDH